MTRCLFIHDFFQDGRADVLSEVRILQVCGQWTKAKRASWIKKAVASYERARRTSPQGSSYYAGRLAGLKSAITEHFPSPRKETAGLAVFTALVKPGQAICRECGDCAAWSCGPVGPGSPMTFLCDRCKQERVREQTAYITPDGWDWDDDEDLLYPLPEPSGSKLVVKEQLRPSSIFLPTTALVGLAWLCMAFHVSGPLLALPILLVLHFDRVKQIPRVIRHLCLVEGEEQ